MWDTGKTKIQYKYDITFINYFANILNEKQKTVHSSHHQTKENQISKDS